MYVSYLPCIELHRERERERERAREKEAEREKDYVIYTYVYTHITYALLLRFGSRRGYIPYSPRDVRRTGGSSSRLIAWGSCKGNPSLAK